ncbi:YadA-like family protein [Psychrobacter sp. DM4]|uniref:YadA-like family protein n=1 Tax=Psychrobacter sp. DM4 TaxID=3440637 RepID=UPI003F4F99D5
MNRNFKVIWNEALGCFTAVAEYAKARGKSSKSSVSANASINTSTSLSAVNTLRLSAIGLGLLAAGLTIPAAANGYYYYYPSGMSFAGDEVTPKVYINTTYRNQTLKVQGGETVTGDPNTKNISVAASNTDRSLTVKLDEDIDLGADGSLNTGDTLIDSSGIMVSAIDPNNNVTLSNTGLNNGNNRISNVEDGIDPKDAVNVRQLDSSIAENKVKYYSVNSDGGANELNEGATGQNAMAMGRNARAIGSQTIAIGSASSGQNTIAKGAQSIAIGANVVSIGASSIAIGGDDLDLASKYNVDGSDIDDALNSGTVNTVFNEYAGRDLLDPNDSYAGHTQALGAASIAMGAKSRSDGHLATAIGIHSSASGTASSAFGIAATASEKGASALGAGANASVMDGVALGSKSVANIAGGVGTEGFVPTGATLADQNSIASTRSESLGAVSVGNDTDGNRQIVKVAAGKNDSDAVNVAQLRGLSNVVDLGLNFDADSGTTVNRELGQTFNINGDSTNISTVTTANGVTVQMSDTPTFTKVTLVDAPTVGTDATNKTYVDGSRTQVTSNNNSISVSETASGDASVFDLSVDAQSLSESAQSPVVYTDATGNRLYKQTDGSFNTSPDGSGDLVTALDVIASMQSATGSTSTPTTLSNIAPGTLASDSTDAVNGSQLYTTNQNVSTNEGNITTNRDNIAKGIKFNVNDSLQKTFDLGEEIKLNTDSNLTTTPLSTNDGIELGLAPNLTGLNSADFGGVNISTEGIDLNNNQITGLASAGDITLGANERNAVNAGDLNNAVGGVTSLGFALRAADNNEVQRNLGDAVDIVGSNNNITTQVVDDKIAIKLNNNLNLGALGTVKTGGNVILNTVVTPLGVVVTGLNPLNPVTLTAAGLNNAGKKIINVKDGAVTSSSSDAVNGSQLYDTNQNVTINEGNITTNQDNIAKGIKFNVNSALQKTFDLGEEIKLNTDDNLTTTLLSTNDGIELGLADVITVGDDMPVMIDGTNGTVSGLSNTTFDASETYTGGVAATQEQLSQANADINTTIDLGLNFDADSGTTVNRELGQTFNINGDSTNISTVTTANGVTVQMSDTPTFTKVTLVDAPTVGTDATNKTYVDGSRTQVTSNNNSISVSETASGDARVFDLSVDAQSLSESAQSPVVYTDTTGNKLYKQTDGSFNTSPDGSGTLVTALDVIASMQSASGSTSTLTRLSNIAPGTLASDSSDAVNGSQLYTTNQNVSTNEGNITTNQDNIAKGIKFNVNSSLQKTFDLGEEIKLNTDSNLTTTLLSTNDGIELGLANIITVGDDMPVMIDGTNGTVSGLSNTTFDASETYTGGVAATQEQLLEVNNSINQTVDRGLDFTGDNTLVTVTRKMGEKLTIKGGEVDANRLASDNNIGVIANDTDNSLTVKLAKDLTGLNSANFGSGVSISANGLNNGSNKITNVADGSTPKDAVNFGQLSDTNTKVDTNTSDIETNTTDIGVNTGNIAKGIKIGDGDSTNDQQFALGDTINITGDSNLTTTASEDGVQIQLNNQLNLGNDGRMQIGNSIIDTDGFTFVGSNSNRTVRLSSMGLDNGGNVLSNVGRGVELTDGVNVGQLQEATLAGNTGWSLSAQRDTPTSVINSNVDMSNTDGNISVTRGVNPLSRAIGGNDLSFDLNSDIVVDSLTTGQSIVSGDGFSIVGGPNMTRDGINAADMKVTNVQNGEVSSSSQDAINGSQMFAQGTGISSIIGGSTVYNAEDGSFTNSNIGGTGESSIDGAIASIKQGEIVINENIATNTTNIETNTTNIATNTTSIGTNTTNIVTNTTNIAENKDKLDAGLNFGADSGDVINKPIGDNSVLSFTGSENITTTADGSSIKFDLNGNISVDSIAAGSTVINSSGISMQGGPSMTGQGINAGDQRITGVADGIEATDAVNYGQLSALDNRLNSNMSDLGYKIDEVEDDANAGISAAMAMSSLPQAYIIGKSMVGGGIATYNGESAVAIGVSKLSGDGRWVIKVNGTADTQGNVGGAVGAGFHFD